MVRYEQDYWVNIERETRLAKYLAEQANLSLRQESEKYERSRRRALALWVATVGIKVAQWIEPDMPKPRDWREFLGEAKQMMLRGEGID